MDSNANLTRSPLHTITAGAKRDNDYETSEDGFVDHQRQVASQESNRRSVPRKPPRKGHSAPHPANSATTAASVTLGLQKPPSSQQTTDPSIVFIHSTQSPLPPSSTILPPISNLPQAPLPLVPPSARSPSNNFPPPPVVPTVTPKIPPLAIHRAAPPVLRTAPPQAPPPVPPTAAFRAAPPVPPLASLRTQHSNLSSDSLQIHYKSPPTAPTRPSIPPPAPPVVSTPLTSVVHPPPLPSLLPPTPPLINTPPLPSTLSPAPHPIQYSAPSASSSTHSNISTSHSRFTNPSSLPMSNIHSFSNSQTSQSCHSLSSVHLSPLNASCSASDTPTLSVSNPSYPAQESQRSDTPESAARQQTTETPPAVRTPHRPCHTIQNEACCSSHGLTDGSNEIDLDKGSSTNQFDNTDSSRSLLNYVGGSLRMNALLQSPDAPKGLNTSKLQPGVSFLLSSSSKSTKSGGANYEERRDLSSKVNDMKGTLLKLVDRKWKPRYFVLKSKFWVLEYYHTMSDAQSASTALRGVYPLLGAQTSGLVEVVQGFQFILTLRTSQMIQLKLPEKIAIERWRDSIQATTQHPLPSFIGEAKNGAAELVQSRNCTTRNIRLNFMNRYLYFYKKNREDLLSRLNLVGANIAMEKGSKKGFDITIKALQDAQTVLRFQTLEEWVSWGTALESCCAISK